MLELPAKFNRRLIYTRIYRDFVMTYDDCFYFPQKEKKKQIYNIYIYITEIKIWTGKNKSWYACNVKAIFKAIAFKKENQIFFSTEKGISITIPSDFLSRGLN